MHTENGWGCEYVFHVNYNVHLLLNIIAWIDFSDHDLKWRNIRKNENKHNFLFC